MYQSLRRASVAPPTAASAAARSGAERAFAAAPPPRHDLRRLVDGAAGVVQRQITDVAGVSNTLDLAVKQAAYDEENGFTPPSINGTRYAQGAADDWAVNALHKPTIAVRNDHDAGAFKATVTVVPDNAVGYHMFLPTAPPWRTAVALDGRRIAYLGITREVEAQREREAREELPPPEGGIEMTTFKKSAPSVALVVTGTPNDAALAGQVTRHETKHSVDITTRRDAVLKPWDLKATQAKDAATEYAGASDPAAREALWAALGGTPEQVAKTLDDHWIADSRAYHASPAGKTRSSVGYDPERITMTVWLTA